MLSIGFSGILEGGSVEVAVVQVDELGYWALRHGGLLRVLKCGKISKFPSS
jgi:hypothetical protein